MRVSNLCLVGIWLSAQAFGIGYDFSTEACRKFLSVMAVTQRELIAKDAQFTANTEAEREEIAQRMTRLDYLQNEASDAKKKAAVLNVLAFHLKSSESNSELAKKSKEEFDKILNIVNAPLPSEKERTSLQGKLAIQSNQELLKSPEEKKKIQKIILDLRDKIQNTLDKDSYWADKDSEHKKKIEEIYGYLGGWPVGTKLTPELLNATQEVYFLNLQLNEFKLNVFRILADSIPPSRSLNSATQEEIKNAVLRSLPKPKSMATQSDVRDYKNKSALTKEQGELYEQEFKEVLPTALLNELRNHLKFIRDLNIVAPPIFIEFMIALRKAKAAAAAR